MWTKSLRDQLIFLILISIIIATCYFVPELINRYERTKFTPVYNNATGQIEWREESDSNQQQILND